MPELGFEDGCAQKLSGPQLCQHVVGLSKRECRRLSLDARLRRNFEKIQSVLAGEVRNRHQLSFLPEQIVREARNIAHMNPGAYHPAALAHRAQRCRYQLSGGSIDDSGIKRSVGQLL